MYNLKPLRHANGGAERWPSGRRHQIANLAYWQRYRGFESLPLRQSNCSASVTFVLQRDRATNETDGLGDLTVTTG